MASSPTGVLLLGSFPGSSAEDVFRRTASALPGRLFSLPDGETGERYNWCVWQIPRFPPFTIRARWGGATPKGSDGPVISLPPTGYDDAALSSYATFKMMKQQGKIAKNVRFQVGFPTPANVIAFFVDGSYHATMLPLYEQRLIEAITRILKEIPHDELAIQFELVIEIMHMEAERGRLDDEIYQCETHPALPYNIENVKRVCAHVPDDVPVGFHLCYGDKDNQHWVEPLDLNIPVQIANGLARSLGRPISWVHMPIPRDRDDHAYFEPLKQLDLPDTTHLYLGLVHAHDEKGTERRIQAAKNAWTRPFGVASECGLGRTPVTDIESILAISKSVSVAWSH